MKLFHALLTLALLHFHLSLTTAAKHEKVLLSEVRSLTLRSGLKTAHRRVSAIPQLKCIGGNARGLYEIDSLRCTNEGSSYSGSEDIQWTCTASLPPEFRLGSTDVICEGYASPDDPYVLKGSCGVEYRLVLTRQGEERHGSRRGSPSKDHSGSETVSRLFQLMFWALFIGVAGWIIYQAFFRARGNMQRGPRRPNGAGGGWGWGGGGGGGRGPHDDPPPPYDYSPKQTRNHGSARAGNAGGNRWNPGFFTGAAGGAAAGYAAGAWQNQRSRNSDGNSRLYDDGGEGSSRSTRSSASNGSGYSATRYESTGFGSTSRR